MAARLTPSTEPHERQHVLCILPPRHIASAIDDVRRQFDKGVERWPAHIRMSFLPGRDSAWRRAVATSLRKFEPFRLTLQPPILGTPNTGARRKDGRTFVTSEPQAAAVKDGQTTSAPLLAIDRVIRTALHLPADSFPLVPWHLTLAQQPSHAEAEKLRKALRQAWGTCDMSWTVTSLSLLELSPQSGMYEESFSFALEGGVDPLCPTKSYGSGAGGGGGGGVSSTRRRIFGGGERQVNFWKSLVRRSESAGASGRWTEALALAESATCLGPDRALGWYLVGAAHIELLEQRSAAADGLSNSKGLCAAVDALRHAADIAVMRPPQKGSKAVAVNEAVSAALTRLACTYEQEFGHLHS